MSGLEKHWKTQELAEQLGMSADTLRRAALRGDVNPVRIGSDLFWPESVVQAWLDRNQVDNSRVVQLHTASNHRRTA